MKSLTEFLTFDIEKFLKGKVLLFVSERDYQKYENNEPVGREGIRAELVILKDNTEYKGGRTQANIFEKLMVKVPTSKQTLGLETNQPVKISNVLKASVYGRYNNELSITAEHVVPVKVQNG